MGVEPIKGKGVNRAKAVCDMCGRDEVVTCEYERQGRSAAWLPNMGQVVRKVTGHGWAEVKGKLHCPACEAKRKAHQAQQKEAKMAVEMKSSTAPVRRPDPKQKRLIILALEDAYDDQAGRYKGVNTDKTISEDLGGGIMPGWVSELREELFGPAGNEEVDEIRSEIARLEKETGRLIEIFAQEQAKKIKVLRERVDAVVASHDKRVRA